MDPDTNASRAGVVVLTGPSRAGKTTVCREVVSEARSRGLSVAGVLTEDGTTPSGPILQIAQDLRTTERQLLATAPRPGEHPPADDTPRPGAMRGDGSRLRWTFVADGVAFGRRAIESAMAEGCDVLVIDQIGPLELRRSGGWRIAFDAIGRRRFGLALVVVNPRVLDEARALLGDCEVVEVDETTRDGLPASISAAYLPAG